MSDSKDYARKFVVEKESGELVEIIDMDIYTKYCYFISLFKNIGLELHNRIHLNVFRHLDNIYVGIASKSFNSHEVQSTKCFMDLKTFWTHKSDLFPNLAPNQDGTYHYIENLINYLAREVDKIIKNTEFNHHTYLILIGYANKFMTATKTYLTKLIRINAITTNYILGIHKKKALEINNNKENIDGNAFNWVGKTCTTLTNNYLETAEAIKKVWHPINYLNKINEFYTQELEKMCKLIPMDKARFYKIPSLDEIISGQI